MLFLIDYSSFFVILESQKILSENTTLLTKALARQKLDLSNH